MSDSATRHLTVDGLFSFDDMVSILELFSDAHDLEAPSRGEVFMLLEIYLAAGAQSRPREAGRGRIADPGAGSGGVVIPIVH